LIIVPQDAAQPVLGQATQRRLGKKPHTSTKDPYGLAQRAGARAGARVWEVLIAGFPREDRAGAIKEFIAGAQNELAIYLDEDEDEDLEDPQE
jgi:hypothetical protein